MSKLQNHRNRWALLKQSHQNHNLQTDQEKAQSEVLLHPLNLLNFKIKFCQKDFLLIKKQACEVLLEIYPPGKLNQSMPWLFEQSHDNNLEFP